MRGFVLLVIAGLRAESLFSALGEKNLILAKTLCIAFFFMLAVSIHQVKSTK